MAAKTIALDPETYSLLRSAKRPGDTFSDVIRRQLRPPSKISDLSGTLADVAPSTWRDIERIQRGSRQRDEQRRRTSERPRRRR